MLQTYFLQYYNTMENYWAYRINKIIIERNLFYPKQHILIALSGGQDSTMLYNVLYYLRIKWQWNIGTIHCDHQWNQDSINHAKSIYKSTYNMNSPLYIAIPIQKVLSEEKARNWRYSLMYKIASSHDYSSIAVGHTSSDRAETLLFNCFRGTSFDGIKSLQWKRTIQNQFIINRMVNYKLILNSSFPNIYLQYLYKRTQLKQLPNIALVRPLLNTTRAEIREQVLKYKIPVCFDKTNENLKIRRNRIRHQLIPYLKKYFNPKIESTLNRLSETTDYDLVYLNSIVKSIYHNSIHMKTEYSVSLQLDVLYAVPINIQRRVLKYFIYLYTHKYLSFDTIESIRLTILYSNKTNYKSSSILFNDSEFLISFPQQIKLVIQNNQLVLIKIL